MNVLQTALLAFVAGLVVGYWICLVRYFRAREGVQLASAETARMMGESAAAIDAAQKEGDLLGLALKEMYEAQKRGEKELAIELALFSAIIQYGRSLDRLDDAYLNGRIPYSLLTAWDGWAKDEALRRKMQKALGYDCF